MRQRYREQLPSTVGNVRKFTYESGTTHLQVYLEGGPGKYARSGDDDTAISSNYGIIPANTWMEIQVNPAGGFVCIAGTVSSQYCQIDPVTERT